MALYQAGVGADVVLIEGQAGLFDNFDAKGENICGDAEWAALSGTPVCLLVDAVAYGTSVAALVKGYSVCARDFSVEGVILNRLSPEQMKYRNEYYAAMRSYELPEPLGFVPESKIEVQLPPNEISQEKNRALLPLQVFAELGDLVSRHINVEALMKAANTAEVTVLENFEWTPSNRRTRIAVSDDSCFNLCYQNNLEWIRYFGAETVSFSPLADGELPSGIGGVYLTGGCIKEYGEELSRNKEMRESLRSFAAAGGVIYAEGSATAFLCDDFKGAEDQVFSGVGIISGSAVSDSLTPSFHEAVTLEETIVGRAGMKFKLVNTGEWKIKRLERAVRALRFEGHKGESILEGYSPGAQVFCTLSLCHFGSNPQVAKNLVDSCQVVGGV